jgi:hypothetical protein
MRVSQTTPAGRQGSAVSGQGDIATVTRRSAPSRVNVSPDDKGASTSMSVDGDVIEAARPLAASVKPVYEQPKVACGTAVATMRGEDVSMKCATSTVETADSAGQPRDDLPRDLPVVLGKTKGRHCAPEARHGDVIAQESDPLAPTHEGAVQSHAVGQGGVSLNPNATPFASRTANPCSMQDGPRCNAGGVAFSTDVSLEQAMPRLARMGPGIRSVHIKGSIEGQKVSLLVDTGAEVTGISYATLARLPGAVRDEFEAESKHTVSTVTGQQVTAKGPVLCHISVNGKTVVDAVIAMEMQQEAILSLPTLEALGCDLTVAGQPLLCAQTKPAYSSSGTAAQPHTYKVQLLKDEVIPSNSQKVVHCLILGAPADGRNLMIAATGESDIDLQVEVANSLAQANSTHTYIRLLNATADDVIVKAGLQVAEAHDVEVIEGTVVNPDDSGEAEIPAHLQELYDQTVNSHDMPNEAKPGLKSLLCKHATLFARHKMDLGHTTIVQHDIDTGDALPIRQPPRRPPMTQQPVIEEEVQKMLEAGIIERGQSPWASPVVLVQKKDGSIRFCVDYRKLNAVTRFDAYPMPRINETQESLAGAKFFSTLDLISGYWQVGLTERAKEKSAFVTRSGLYLWRVMPMGLTNSGSCFERLMETVLRGLNWEQCLIYLDDVVVFAPSWQEMLARLDTVFSRLAGAGLKLKPRKCRLFARKTDYLGHVVSEHGIAVNPAKVSAMLEWPTPRCVTEVKSFLGTASYYRRFVKDFATIAAPLHCLTDDANWQWTDEEQQAFDRLKAVLAVVPVLKFPVPDAQYVLDTDASLTGIGAVLSQIIDGEERVLSYASRTLSQPERNYCVTRREMLALIWSLKHFRPYLHGRSILIRTDHASLQWLKNFKEPDDQTARWLEILERFDYKIMHRPGKRHGNADGLSRQRCNQCGRWPHSTEPEAVTASSAYHNNPVLMQEAATPSPTSQVRLLTLQPRWSEADFRALQLQDPALAPFLRAVETGQYPSHDIESAWPPQAKHYLRDWERMTIINGVLARQWFDKNGNMVRYQWVAPRAVVLEILQQAHDNPMSGHFAHKRTLSRVREIMYWQGMDGDTRRYCQACAVCCERKRRPTVPHHPAQRQVTSEPLQLVALDIAILSKTDRGNSYVLVVVDYFTKWLCIVPMPDQTAETCATAFVTEFVCNFGVPQQLHSDQGRQWESALWIEMCKRLHTHKSHTTPLHPQGDGQAERSVQTVKDILSKLARDEPKNWDVWLPYVKMAYNSSVHRVTGETPHFLMRGVEMRTPVTLLAPPCPGVEPCNDWVARMQEMFRTAHAAVVERTKASHRAEAPRIDRRQKNYVFKEKDLVRLWDPKPKLGYSPALDPHHWSGPWEVTKRISACVYALKHVNTGKKRIVNVDRMEPYVTLDEDRFPRSSSDTPDNDVTDDTGQRQRKARREASQDEWWPIGMRTESDDVTRAAPQAADTEEAGRATWPAIPLSFTATRRAQRARQAPAWHSAYDMEQLA